jgi:hypothetical protein
MAEDKKDFGPLSDLALKNFQISITEQLRLYLN